MKALLFIALIFPVLARAEPCSSGISGPCMPNDILELRKPIMNAITDGLAAHEAMDNSYRSAAVADSDELKLIYLTSARQSEEQMRDSFDQAIRLTQSTYHLTPQAPGDPRAQKPMRLDGAWITNRKAPWNPRFRISEYREITGMDGNSHYFADDPRQIPGSNAAAMTDPDGTVTIFLNVMELAAKQGDPGLLATVIQHESVHYRDLISTGWDTHERMEIRAFTESLTMADVLMLPGADRDQLKTYFNQLIAGYKNVIASGNEHSPFADKDQEIQYKNAFDAQNRREAEYQDLVKRVARAKQDERERLAAIQRDIRWQKFRIWTLYACEYIDGVHEGDPEWGNPDAIRARDDGFRNYLTSNLVVMPKTEIDAGLKRDDLYHGGSIGTCQEQVVDMLRNLPGPVDDDWIMSKIEYERHGGKAGEIITGLINSVQQAVLDGTAAIVEIATAPFTAEVGTGSSGGGNPGNRSGGSGGGGSTGTPNIDTLPWRQLGGISRSGWGPN